MSIGNRGFGTRLSRSVLVLIDGRTVHTPLFAGTYWEVQNTLLEDIDRIEVILSLVAAAGPDRFGYLPTPRGTVRRTNLGRVRARERRDRPCDRFGAEALGTLRTRTYRLGLDVLRRNEISSPLTTSGCSCCAQCPAPSIR